MKKKFLALTLALCMSLVLLAGCGGGDQGGTNTGSNSASGGNEGGTMQRTGAGVRTCVLSVPCRYIHSPSTVCAASDIEAQFRLAKAFLEK